MIRRRVTPESETERLTRLESSTESLAEAVGGVVVAVKELRHDVSTLSNRVGAVGRWDTKTIIAFIGGLVTLFIGVSALCLTTIGMAAGLLWVVGIQPMNTRLDKAEGDTRLVWQNTEARLSEIRDTISPLGLMVAKLQEIETQFDTVTKLRETQNDTLHYLIRPLLKRVFDVDLPMPTYHPEPQRPATLLNFGR